MTDVAVIGAGPYGLSIAAYLKARGVDFRIIGAPMRTWLDHMPKGMHLKSEGFASTLFDKDSKFTLGHYCREKGLPYADLGVAVPLSTFTSYGLEFQKRLLPELEDRMVKSLTRTASGFQLRLDNGEQIGARRVVAAIGISHFAHVPELLRDLPKELASHSADHHTFDQFRDRDVVVIGAGSSAVDVAASAHQAGARVRVVGRRKEIRFHNPPRERSMWERVSAPMSGLGPGWRSLLCTEAPLVFHQMPEKFRLLVVQKHLGPAPGWAVRQQVEGRVPFSLGRKIDSVSVRKDRLELQVSTDDGAQETILADHVIAGTGYRVDLRRVDFLSAVLPQIDCAEHTPILSTNFESSVKGLYFVGVSAANSFGPLLRFAYGAGFTARRLTRHLARSASRS